MNNKNLRWFMLSADTLDKIKSYGNEAQQIGILMAFYNMFIIGKTIQRQTHSSNAS
jgi:hypothetical protein